MLVGDGNGGKKASSSSDDSASVVGCERIGTSSLSQLAGAPLSLVVH